VFQFFNHVIEGIGMNSKGVFYHFLFEFYPRALHSRKKKIKEADEKLGVFLAYLQELPFRNPVLVVWLVA